MQLRASQPNLMEIIRALDTNLKSIFWLNRSSIQLRRPCARRYVSSKQPASNNPTASNPLPEQSSTTQSTTSLLSALGNSFKSSQSSNYSPNVLLSERVLPSPYHLHVYSTKHNTHMALTRPNRDPIISISAGNIGFRKAARGKYDAAYQLGAYMMSRIQQQGLLKEITQLELVFRGFGEGREAVKKILLGSEGMALRPRFKSVTDTTRLKFGGTRSKKPRRLG